MTSSRHRPVLPIRLFQQARWRRRIILFLTFAVLFAGVAQAAHYHKSDFVPGGGTHVHCLLCLFAASSASPPVPVRVIPSPAPRFCSYRCPASDAGTVNSEATLYDARGPPAA